MKKLEGVQITVLQNGKQFDQFTTSGSGKYTLELPLGSDYIIEFSKGDYVAKKIEIKTKNIPEEDQRGGFQLAMDMSLFQYVEGFNTDILNKPIGRAGFDPQKNSINFDFGYTQAVQEDIEEEFERLEDLEKNMAKMLKQFEDLIKKGDQKMAEEKYADAVGKYEEALDIFPDKEPAPEKLAEAQRKLDELNALAEKEAEYLRLIEEGEKNIGKERYEDAQANYQDALDLKPDERLPKDKLKEIEGILADAEKREQYKKIVDQADAYFKNKDYPVAIETYEEALDLFPNEEYPRDQINEAKRILDAELAAAMEAEELEKKYNDLITLGDRNFDAESYRDAIRNYQQASDLKSDEKYPKDQIEKIEGILADLEAQ
ncbi:MAG: tetratricopeptide repeat protein, partial [Flavobacteriales bacterium]|nr:tetratricopeptide repeat protein [Flavobacteriales bacterium]